MAAARARWRFLALPLALLLAIGSSRGLVSPDPAPKPPVPKAISDLRDAIVKGLGFQSEELKVSGFDVRDALVGQAVAYEFDMEVGRKVVPVRLLEDVSRWDFVDLPIFRTQADADDAALAEIGRGARGSFEPTLPPFQLAGPMELWIQDGDDVRLALPKTRVGRFVGGFSRGSARVSPTNPRKPRRVEEEPETRPPPRVSCCWRRSDRPQPRLAAAQRPPPTAPRSGATDAPAVASPRSPNLQPGDSPSPSSHPAVLPTPPTPSTPRSLCRPSSPADLEFSPIVPPLVLVGLDEPPPSWTLSAHLILGGGEALDMF